MLWEKICNLILDILCRFLRVEKVLKGFNHSHWILKKLKQHIIIFLNLMLDTNVD